MGESKIKALRRTIVGWAETRVVGVLAAKGPEVMG